MGLDLDERAIWLGRHVLPHEPALKSWLHGRCPPGLEVEDIVQETYSRLISLENPTHIRNPKTYAFETAKSVIYTHLRRARIVAFDMLADTTVMEIPAEAPSPEISTIDRDELKRISKAIGDLPSRVRKVFLMRRVEEKSQKRIAMELQLSESSVERLMSTALFRLRHSLGRESVRTTSAPGPASGKTHFDARQRHEARERRGD